MIYLNTILKTIETFKIIINSVTEHEQILKQDLYYITLSYQLGFEIQKVTKSGTNLM